jgi:hypothetical protein
VTDGLRRTALAVRRPPPALRRTRYTDFWWDKGGESGGFLPKARYTSERSPEWGDLRAGLREVRRVSRGPVADGAWDDRYGRPRTQPSFDGSLILVTSRG